MNFADQLIASIREKKTPLVVGIDPRCERLPQAIQQAVTLENTDAEKYLMFSKAIIDVVAPLVPAIKPQMAFFEELGAAGMVALQHVVDHAKSKGLLVIMDGKRNDIGSTAAAYAAAYLGAKPKSSWGCDALTVNPWMGHDSLDPFIETGIKNDAGIFALVKTSNPGSKDFQEQVCDGQPMFKWIAKSIQKLAEKTKGQGGYGIAGSVVGATYPEQLDELRSLMPNSFFLIPGFGAQGGTAADVAGGFDQNGLGAVVNSSRGIIFAYEKADCAEDNDEWLQAVEQATHDAIAKLKEHTPAGNL